MSDLSPKCAPKRTPITCVPCSGLRRTCFARHANVTRLISPPKSGIHPPVASWQQRPESRGHVRARSADPFAPPIIQTNYLVAELDRRVVVAGMKLARRLLKSAPLAPYYAHEDFPGPDVQTDDEFLAAATQRGTTTFHPGCTCRMGPADAPWGGRQSD
jgi:hypothetical protein